MSVDQLLQASRNEWFIRQTLLSTSIKKSQVSYSTRKNYLPQSRPNYRRTLCKFQGTQNFRNQFGTTKVMKLTSKFNKNFSNTDLSDALKLRGVEKLRPVIWYSCKPCHSKKTQDATCFSTTAGIVNNIREDLSSKYWDTTLLFREFHGYNFIHTALLNYTLSYSLHSKHQSRKKSDATSQSNVSKSVVNFKSPCTSKIETLRLCPLFYKQYTPNISINKKYHIVLTAFEASRKTSNIKTPINKIYRSLIALKSSDSQTPSSTDKNGSCPLPAAKNLPNSIRKLYESSCTKKQIQNGKAQNAVKPAAESTTTQVLKPRQTTTESTSPIAATQTICSPALPTCSLVTSKIPCEATVPPKCIPKHSAKEVLCRKRMQNRIRECIDNITAEEYSCKRAVEIAKKCTEDMCKQCIQQKIRHYVENQLVVTPCSQQIVEKSKLVTMTGTSNKADSEGKNKNKTKTLDTNSQSKQSNTKEKTKAHSDAKTHDPHSQSKQSSAKEKTKVYSDPKIIIRTREEILKGDKKSLEDRAKAMEERAKTMQKGQEKGGKSSRIKNLITKLLIYLSKKDDEKRISSFEETAIKFEERLKSAEEERAKIAEKAQGKKLKSKKKHTKSTAKSKKSDDNSQCKEERTSKRQPQKVIKSDASKDPTRKTESKPNTSTIPKKFECSKSDANKEPICRVESKQSKLFKTDPSLACKLPSYPCPTDHDTAPTICCNAPQIPKSPCEMGADVATVCTPKEPYDPCKAVKQKPTPVCIDESKPIFPCQPKTGTTCSSRPPFPCKPDSKVRPKKSSSPPCKTSDDSHRISSEPCAEILPECCSTVKPELVCKPCETDLESKPCPCKPEPPPLYKSDPCKLPPVCKPPVLCKSELHKPPCKEEPVCKASCESEPVCKSPCKSESTSNEPNLCKTEPVCKSKSACKRFKPCQLDPELKDASKRPTTFDTEKSTPLSEKGKCNRPIRQKKIASKHGAISKKEYNAHYKASSGTRCTGKQVHNSESVSKEPKKFKSEPVICEDTTKAPCTFDSEKSTSCSGQGKCERLLRQKSTSRNDAKSKASSRTHFTSKQARRSFQPQQRSQKFQKSKAKKRFAHSLESSCKMTPTCLSFSSTKENTCTKPCKSSQKVKAPCVDDTCESEEPCKEICKSEETCMQPCLKPCKPEPCEESCESEKPSKESSEEFNNIAPSVFQEKNTGCEEISKSGTYKNPEYFSYHKMSFHEMIRLIDRNSERQTSKCMDDDKSECSSNNEEIKVKQQKRKKF